MIESKLSKSILIQIKYDHMKCLIENLDEHFPKYHSKLVVSMRTRKIRGFVVATDSRVLDNQRLTFVALQ